MKIIFSKKFEGLYLSGVILRSEILLGMMDANREKAMEMADAEADKILKQLDGGTKYWGSKPIKR